MRHQGTIVSWDLGRGIGAIQWHGGEERVFVRVTDFPEGIRRPEVGDVVTYFRGIDHRGRPIASIVEYATAAGQHPPLAAVHAVHAADARARSVPEPGARAPAGHAAIKHAAIKQGRHMQADSRDDAPSFARESMQPAVHSSRRVVQVLVLLVVVAVAVWVGLK